MDHIDNDSDFKSTLRSHIEEIVSEISPLTAKHERDLFTKSKAEEIFKDLSEHVEEIKSYDLKQYEEQFNILCDTINATTNEKDKIIEEQERHIEDLRSEITDLNSEIEDLKMRINQPGKWW
jgi:chromosome segregation ATPase